MKDVPSPDEGAHQDGRLMHELSAVNAMLSRYVMQFLDADAGRIEPLSMADERTLAARLAEAAGAVQARVERREQHDDPAPLIERFLSDERP